MSNTYSIDDQPYDENVHGIPIVTSAKGVEIPVLCTNCNHYESQHGCALKIFLPVKKGDCGRFYPRGVTP